MIDNVKDAKTMTVEKCGKFCINKGHKTFGLQAGSECWCGSELDAASKPAPETECENDSPGNPEQTCGGSKRLNVYQWKH